MGGKYTRKEEDEENTQKQTLMANKYMWMMIAFEPIMENTVFLVLSNTILYIL